MLIVNADDWGRSKAETDAAFSCFKQGRITSATAMVFMEDSARGADLAGTAGIDVGLHLNLSQTFSVEVPSKLRGYHEQIVRFLTTHKYAMVFYHPLLREQFRYVYSAQVEEFHRLFGKLPSHIDGHQHKHYCSNMLIDRIMPEGQKVRRTFSFGPGDKSAVNRAYRGWVDRRLGSQHQLTDYFFALLEHSDLETFQPVARLAQDANVEVMTHPVVPKERDFMLSDEYLEATAALRFATFATL
jgi:predicted glycoside hydrolase/deacetylase ChbG (UPF0249 family)